MNFSAVYPNWATCAYKEIGAYWVEVIRLFDFLNELGESVGVVDEKTLFCLTIGAVMEEAKDVKHWEQLFPIHLQFFALNHCVRDEDGKSKNRVVIAIVAPNASFGRKEPPMFIKLTPEFQWEISGGMYKSASHNLSVHVFYTTFPHKWSDEERIRNETTIKHYERIGLWRQMNTTLSEGYIELKQDENTIEFIDSFYASLNGLIENIHESGGFSFCMSFAVFRNGANPYSLFPEIQKVNFYKGFLCEWKWDTKEMAVYSRKIRKIEETFNYSDDEESHCDAFNKWQEELDKTPP